MQADPDPQRRRAITIIAKRKPRPGGAERTREEGGRNRVTGNRSARSRPLAPPQHRHGSRLPTISRGEPQVDVSDTTPRSALGKPQRKSPAASRAPLLRARLRSSRDHIPNRCQTRVGTMPTRSVPLQLYGPGLGHGGLVPMRCSHRSKLFLDCPPSVLDATENHASVSVITQPNITPLNDPGSYVRNV